jgi:hypothetical protein
VGGRGTLAGWGGESLGVGLHTGFTEVVGIVLGQLNLEELHVVQAEVTQPCMPCFRGDDMQTMLMCCALRVYAPLDKGGVSWDVISGQRTRNKLRGEIVGVRVLLRSEQEYLILVDVAAISSEYNCLTIS